MKEIWIKKRGTASEAELPALITSFCKVGEKTVCCFYTDHFQSALITTSQDPHLEALLMDAPLLLEMRLFDSVSELYLFRSAIGQPFSYRVADDRTLEENLQNEQDPFMRLTETHRMEQIQLLDLDSGYPLYKQGSVDPYGCLLLRSTGGGKYSLPLSGREDSIIVVSYIDYDDNGIATIGDSRWAGFIKETEWRKSHESC